MQYQRHRVIAALVLAPVDGKIHYVYSGGLVPLGVPQARLDDWLAGKLIKEVAGPPVDRPNAEQLVKQLAAAGVTVSVEEAQAILDKQTAPPAVEAVEPDEDDADQDEDDAPPKGALPPLPPGAPGRSAAKPKWEAYLVTLGMDEEAVKAATKDELIERALALTMQD